MPEQYYTHEGRVASFRPTQQVGRRNSTAKGKASKTCSWPHEQLDPDKFANAGFYFAPTPEYPDNTVCFLCYKNMGGWEEDDDPFVEHLRLSPHCGWALVAGIEMGLGDYALDDPTGTEMVNARKATFGDRWPHDGKRGWKCKTKQLADAGWKHTPTAESDDMATCTYCELALDGWEPKDDPLQEHFRRSPHCPFFVLKKQYKEAAAAKKRGRGKAARSSKASRVSTQSVATVASDVTSLLEHSVDHDDSVLTTTSIMTQGGTKRPRGRKATAKGKRSRPKKEEVVEVLEDPPEDTQLENHEEPLPTEAEVVVPKPARGRKRKSDTIEDSVLSTVEAPAPKKRAARGNRVSKQNVDHAMFDPKPPEIDHAEIEAELKELQANMEAKQEQIIQVPKKARQAGTRKVSKQTTKRSKAKAPVEPEPIAVPDVDELADGEDGSILSNTSTIVRTSLSATTTTVPKKRGRPSKQSLAMQAASQPEPVTQPGPAPEARVEHTDRVELEPALPITQKVAASKVPKKISFSSRDKSLPPPPPESPDLHLQPPSTPKAMMSPAPAAPSPSQSPQSSDAENQPPSSKPSNTSRSARIALAPVPATPVRSSPSKQNSNIIGGLESTDAWTAVDIENVFEELEKDRAKAGAQLIRSGADLTSPEKRMTVKEWIYYNAGEAEKQLQSQCEGIVTAFEREGNRAMKALEGVIVE